MARLLLAESLGDFRYLTRNEHGAQVLKLRFLRFRLENQNPKRQRGECKARLCPKTLNEIVL